MAVSVTLPLASCRWRAAASVSRERRGAARSCFPGFCSRGPAPGPTSRATTPRRAPAKGRRRELPARPPPHHARIHTRVLRRRGRVRTPIGPFRAPPLPPPALRPPDPDRGTRNDKRSTAISSSVMQYGFSVAPRSRFGVLEGEEGMR